MLESCWLLGGQAYYPHKIAPHGARPGPERRQAARVMSSFRRAMMLMG